MRIKWIGHATFIVEVGNKIVYFDPYVFKEDNKNADLILITHDHFDHCDIDVIRRIVREDTIIIGNKRVVEKIRNNGIVADIREVKVGDNINVGFCKVQVVEAYNTNKRFHPRGYGVGFVFEAEGKRIYHAGDTDFIEEMKNLKNIDVALLPISGVYVMDMEDALEAAKTMKVKIVVPMHYNYLEGLEKDAKKFMEMCKKIGIRTEILEKKELKL